MTQHNTQTGRVFGSVADAYRKRPSQFPRELYEEIATLYPLTSNARVLDVECGTGEAARALAEIYPNIYGLEPSFEMLCHAAQSEMQRPILWIKGIAEQLPFATQKIDLITAAQSFQWFDGGVFLKEAKRVLKPKGLIAMFWKGAKRGEPYRKLMDQTIDKQLCARNLPTPLGDVKCALSHSGFIEVRVKEFEYEIEWTVESYVGFISSTSRMAQLDTKQREELIPHLRAALREEVGQDQFAERNVVILYTGRNPK